ncbi:MULTISPECIES: phenylalanine 4-monooxygenase [Vitreoscilla]|uniref:Phenylalanine-4-hydroxylase n=1 Tax=Vitreoscilla stercoraria TaxID=61 RepID=A0ABY4EC72_VITST|nr:MULTISPECIES: phenylalanine 4-monooxygenase [Vitreoscilla]AUZ05583.1 phenylalanine-4-hydroxylase [Vitreoscilla sp. C1]UOO92999.1 phenylalanine 4-monooxygenase [Vitreoscilla stercoraria]
METQHVYTAKQSDAHGHIAWTEVEDETWQRLLTRQLSHLQDKACDEYLLGLERLDLPQDHIPNLQDISRVLYQATGWQCAEVPALISFDRFFKLLSERKFPVATFIRRPEDMDYLQEPDIFHEIFGHCAMLTHPAFADFTAQYGKLGMAASKQERAYLARLYWFTVEFGLLETSQGRKIYGGGILSSPQETDYAFASQVPERRMFHLSDVLRTRYRIDVLQPIYYHLTDVNDLYDLAHIDIMSEVRKAQALGLFPLPEAISH